VAGKTVHGKPAANNLDRLQGDHTHGRRFAADSKVPGGSQSIDAMAENFALG
jgi:hypothetical protein